MSSVLLTMVGSQCGKRNPQAALLDYVSLWAKLVKNLLIRLTQASWLHAKGTSLQKQVYRGRTVLYMVVITRGFSPPLDLFAFALHFPTHSAWHYGKPHETNCYFYKLLFEFLSLNSVDFLLHWKKKWEQWLSGKTKSTQILLLLIINITKIDLTDLWLLQLTEYRSGLHTTPCWPNYGYLAEAR